MKTHLLKRWWHVLLAEPSGWMFFYFFQPTKFKSDFEQSFLRRLVLILRLLPLVFLYVYPVSLLVRFILPPLVPDLYAYTLANTGIGRFFFDTAWATIVGMAGGILGTMAISAMAGVTLCMSIGVLAGILVDTATTAAPSSEVAITVGIIYGILFGLLFGITASDAQDTRVSTALASILASIIIAIVGIIVGLTAGFLGGLLLGTLNPGIAGSDHTQSTSGAVAGAILGVSVMAFIGGIIRDLSRRRSGNILRAVTVGRSIGIAFSLLAGLSGGVIGLIATSRNIPLIATNRNNPVSEIQYFGSLGATIALSAGGVFILCYVIGYFRLPLYPASALSSMKAYVASLGNPAGVFHYLHQSSLYWDERVFLPLPRLEETLLIASERDIQGTLREIAFIVAERPQQMVEARQVLFAIALEDLEQRRSLSEIGQADVRLYELLPPQVRQVRAAWVQSLASLGDASRNAALSVSPASRQIRQRALDEMMIDLNNVHPNSAFEDGRLNRKLGAITRQWMAAAQTETERLRSAPVLQDALENPYISGPALQLDASSFVGRRDLTRQLELTLDRGVNRPTFFLIGERRMGKTSTLHNLPRMLSARYIPLYFDLQSRGISANTVAFLSSIAEEVSAVMETRGLPIRRLEYNMLQEASRNNAALAYRLFDAWLKELERPLARRDLTILLAFDEFEHLQTARAAGSLDLDLLQDWFRSVMQNRPRMALLFSGVHGIDEMEPGWAGHFVSVQTLKVSYLRSEEAYDLILHPTPDYPGEQMYGEGVAAEIVRVTGGHPFLIQAVCSALIELLDTQKRRQAERDDVPEAVQLMFERWWNTYFRDLWDRTTPEQQLCLFALQRCGAASLAEVVRQSTLSEHSTHETLETLRQRDLVIHAQEKYWIATPVFQEWVARWSALRNAPA